MSKQIKLKSLLKEGFAWERKPGKPLPTIQEVMDEFQASQKAEIPPVPVKEGENISSKYWVIGKDKRGDLYVFNDGYYNTKEEAEAAFKNIIVPKIVDANTIKVEPVPSSPNYTALYNNLSESSLEEEPIKETDISPEYDKSLLGPQIMSAAKEYARGKAQNSMMEISLAKAFIAGILWKTKN